MKDLLKTIIHSTFRFILNPTVWSQVFSDNSQPAPALTTQNIVSITSGHDIRDINLSKALDIVLAHKQQLMEPSQVQNVPIESSDERNRITYNSDTSGVSSNMTEEANATETEPSQAENITSKAANDTSLDKERELFVETENSPTDDLLESQSSKSSSYSVLSSSDFDSVATMDDEIPAT